MHVRSVENKGTTKRPNVIGEVPVSRRVQPNMEHILDQSNDSDGSLE